MKASLIMIQSMLGVALSFGGLGQLNYTSTLISLLQASTLGECGMCAICAACSSLCPADITSLDEPSIFSSVCQDTNPTSLSYWSCLCKQSAKVNETIINSLNACESNGIPSSLDNLTDTFAEFSLICTNVSSIAAPKSTASFTFTGYSASTSNSSRVSYTGSTTNTATSSKGLLGLSKP